MAQYQTDDLRIKHITEVLSPAELHEQYPLTDTAAQTVYDTRQNIHNILAGRDDRILVIIGPCSIHDPAAARDYASRLKGQIEKYKDDLLIVMRVYFEKPRTSIGWKGLINDPDL
ncbi:MAG TPA: 3-deoxy-7-phosphoheptulonate synthase, partial [Thiomicrorhabdus sp.]|nr:3-deoxy-7-phosphoheptulonate synthase [Thiomicrorhabdus sp.]